MNEQLKPYKTVEEIAKKHRLEVSFIQKQLDMGAPIEHEHTKNRKLAKEIALQHLDEIPDYYTRLKKMEADAKKHHKKFKDVKEGNLHKWFNKSSSKDGKPGWVNVVTGGTCASDEPGEGTPKCVSSAKRASMTPAERRSASRRKKVADPGQQSKSGAEKPTYVSTDKPKMNEEKDIKGKGSGKKDACYSKVKSRYDVWPSAYASGALVKCRKVGAANWGTKSEDCWDGYKQEGMKKKGKKIVPNCVPVREEQAMIRYCPKCKKDETQSECKYGPKFWAMYSTPSMLTTNQLKYNIAQVHPANEGYDHEHSMARSELSTIISAAKRLRKKMKGEGNIEAWVQSKITKAADYLDSAADYVSSGEMKEMKCWKGHKKVGTQKLFGKYYNRCVKKEDVSIEDANGNPYVEFIDIIKPEKMKGLSESRNLKTFHQFMEDWQSANRKDRTDGMSRETVKKYRDENPGSKLQTAVTEKNPKGKRAKRRASFCRRMKGMKSKLTSAKTARDPDSRINKALRRWNCN